MTDKKDDVCALSLEQLALLKKPLPPQAITKHPTKSYLSTIRAIYVVERFNDVFGVGKWKQSNKVILKEGKWVVVKLTITIPEYGFEFEAFGGNDNSDIGDAYKGASTDALTKIGSFLGIGMDVFKGLGDKPSGKIPATVDDVLLPEDALTNKSPINKLSAFHKVEDAISLVQVKQIWDSSESLHSDLAFKELVTLKKNQFLQEAELKDDPMVKAIQGAKTLKELKDYYTELTVNPTYKSTATEFKVTLSRIYDRKVKELNNLLTIKYS